MTDVGLALSDDLAEISVSSIDNGRGPNCWTVGRAGGVHSISVSLLSRQYCTTHSRKTPDFGTEIFPENRYLEQIVVINDCQSESSVENSFGENNF